MATYNTLNDLMKEVALAVRDDMRTNIDSGKMFGSAFPRIGEATVPVTKLAGYTINIKRKRGMARPAVARYGTGGMYRSIASRKSSGNSYKIGPAQSGLSGLKTKTMQLGGEISDNGNTYIVPPRPFVGVSSNGKRAVDFIIKSSGQKITREISKDLLRSTNKIEVRFVVT